MFGWASPPATDNLPRRFGQDGNLMHDTAFHIGTLAMNIYADLRTDSILEVGSQAINGSLRDSALPSTRYVGLDIEEGDGVDLVVEPGKPFPVENDSFDLVMATSVFEHDPAFWNTFVEMCRATKDGGYIYISAPSNGVVHRYPQDNWRFYPDSGKALAAWAASQGVPVMLVESFVAKRENDIWNDFVAVFRKGPIEKRLPKVFLHEHVPCTNVLTWRSNKVVNPSDETEDIMLLREALERSTAAETELSRAAGERDALGREVGDLNARLSTLNEECQKHAAELEKLRADINLRESELRQRHEEIAQTNAQLARARASIVDSEQRAKHETMLRQQAEFMLASSKERYEREQVAQDQRIRALEQERASVEAHSHERFEEIASLTRMLAKAEAASRASRERLEWLRETSAVFVNGSTTLKGRLLALLPAALAHKRQQRLLEREGLFDAESYLQKNPDVASNGMNPLGHYIFHGMDEGRQI